MADVVFADRCRFFNGIQHDKCEAGVRYLDVRDSSPKGPYRWPCMTPYGRDASTTTCPKQSLLTQDEQKAQHEENLALIAKAFEDVSAGKCPSCGAPIEPSKVVGRCKYASCGHRLGQVAGDEP